MLRALGTLAACALWLTTATACFENTDLADSITEAATGSDASDASGDGDGDGDTSSMAADCETYCSFQSACDDDFPQYGTIGPCLSVCAGMPLGETSDQTGNTVGCRTFYAIQAGENTADKEDFCRRSGPTGDGVCGGVCESFCEIAQAACTGDNQVFDDTLSCLEACGNWNTDPFYDANVPEDDTYACRMKHLTYATVDPVTHCSHVAADSPVCVSP